jgi:hypothetical protein
MTALTTLAAALDGAHEPGSSSARFLAWALSREGGYPSAAAEARLLAGRLADFDPEAPPTREAIDAHQAQLADATRKCEARLRDAGGDPYVLPERPR